MGLHGLEFGIEDALGIAGFLLYAACDTLLALRVLNSEQIRFYLLYAAAAALILASLLVDFNLGALLTEMVALITCVVAIALRLAHPRTVPVTRQRLRGSATRSG